MTDQSPNVKLGSVPVGDGHPPVFLAEIGALFNQDVAQAERLIARIAFASREQNTLPVLLKGEILHDPSICLDDATTETYRSRNGERKTERYRELIERKVLPLDAYSRIFDVCKTHDLPVCMSVYDFRGAEFAVSQGVAAIKIASSNLTHVPLIRHAAKLGAPLIIDTGRASLAEIDRAMRTAQDAGARGIVLEHSPDGHPAPPENHNLRMLQTLRQCFSVPVGLSDHAAGPEMMHVAIGLGASLIERNIVETAGQVEQDHAFASSIADIEQGLLVRLRESWTALGRPFRDVANRSGLIATSIRMGLVTKRPVVAGEDVSLDTVTFAFPKHGIGVEFYDKVAGWTFCDKMPAGQPIFYKDLNAIRAV